MSIREDLIDIAIDKQHIAGTIMMPTARLPGVLFVHGWGGSQAHYLARAREIAALGCVCLTFDLRGHAGTQSENETVSREINLRDIAAAYDLLAKHHSVDPAAIAIVGSSYGGYLATILTTMRHVKWLALRAPALYMDAGWELPKRQLHIQQDLITYRKSIVPAGDNRALRACAEFKGDLLIVESEFDDIVPHSVTTSYREAGKSAHSLTFRVIKGADHGLTEVDAQRSYTSLLVNWLSEMFTGALRRSITAETAPAPKEELPERPPMRA